MMSPLFSIIIPARDEEGRIGRCISSILSSELSAESDITLVDDNSSDRTAAVARELGAHVLEAPGSHRIGALRNLGARSSRGDVIVFLDADMIVPRDWLVIARAHFSGGFQGAFGLLNVPPPEAGWVARTWCDRIRFPTGISKETSFLAGRNIFVNRTVFEAAGGFSENLLAGEDKDFCLRIMERGHRIMISSETILVHLGYERGIREFVAKEFWRQGHTLALARAWNYSFRTLRNPLLSLWHVIVPLFGAAAVLLGPSGAGFVFLIAWLMPSALIAAARSANAAPAESFAFFLLTFTRWNVSGAALLRQLGLLLIAGRTRRK